MVVGQGQVQGFGAPPSAPCHLHIEGSSQLLPSSSLSHLQHQSGPPTLLPSSNSPRSGPSGLAAPVPTPSVFRPHCSVPIRLNKHAPSLAPVLSAAPAILTEASSGETGCLLPRAFVCAISSAQDILPCSSLPLLPCFFLVNCHLSILIPLKY